MTLQELYDVSNLFSSHKKISYISRISDNVILLQLDSINYNIDLNKNTPNVYINNEFSKNKIYNAPFDIALQKINKSFLKSCKLDSMNKILILECEVKNKYKSISFFLYLEFITRFSNAILVNNNIIISALRFYETNEREIMPRAIFTPLKQPNFVKNLIKNDINLTREKLLQNYTNTKNIELENKRKILIHSLMQKINKLESILINLPNIKDLENKRLESLELANFILLNLDSIPKYAKSIEINGKQYEIPIESKPSLASDKLFRNSKKLKQKIQNIYIQKENLESKITFLHNKLDFAKCATLEELNILQQKKTMSKKETKKYYETFYINGIRVSMGRNASENIKLLKDSKADFYWLHILNIPSSHLIIHAKNVDSKVLEYAGTFLAKLNGINGKIVIDYTKRKFVKITQGSNVVYSKESKLHLNI